MRPNRYEQGACRTKAKIKIKQPKYPKLMGAVPKGQRPFLFYCTASAVHVTARTCQSERPDKDILTSQGQNKRSSYVQFSRNFSLNRTGAGRWFRCCRHRCDRVVLFHAVKQQSLHEHASCGTKTKKQIDDPRRKNEHQSQGIKESRSCRFSFRVSQAG